MVAVPELVVHELVVHELVVHELAVPFAVRVRRAAAVADVAAVSGAVATARRTAALALFPAIALHELALLEPVVPVAVHHAIVLLGGVAVHEVFGRAAAVHELPVHVFVALAALLRDEFPLGLAVREISVHEAARRRTAAAAVGGVSAGAADCS